MRRLHLLDVFDMALAVAFGIALAGYFFGSIGADFGVLVKLFCSIMTLSVIRWVMSPRTHDIIGPEDST